jgi:hypothetical protein
LDDDDDDDDDDGDDDVSFMMIMSKYFMVYRQDCSGCKQRKFFEDASNLVQNRNRKLFEQNIRYMK